LIPTDQHSRDLSKRHNCYIWYFCRFFTEFKVVFSGVRHPICTPLLGFL
jgi:hypothetical protein